MNRRLNGRRGRPVRSLSVKAIRSLYAQGLSFRAIADIFGIGYGTVRRAFHGEAPHGADTSRSEIRLTRKSTKPRGKLKTAAA